MFSDVVPLQDRGTWQGYRNVVFALGLVVGAWGGAITDHLGWGWCVYRLLDCRCDADAL